MFAGGRWRGVYLGAADEATWQASWEVVQLVCHQGQQGTDHECDTWQDCCRDLKRRKGEGGRGQSQKRREQLRDR